MQRSEKSNITTDNKLPTPQPSKPPTQPKQNICDFPEDISDDDDCKMIELPSNNNITEVVNNSNSPKQSPSEMTDPDDESTVTSIDASVTLNKKNCIQFEHEPREILTFTKASWSTSVKVSLLNKFKNTCVKFFTPSYFSGMRL